MKILFALVSLLAFCPFAFAQESALILQELKVDVDFEAGCGCSILGKDSKMLVFSDILPKAPAILKMNGKKTSLKWISSDETPSAFKMGQKFSRVYGDGDTKLTLKFKTTEVCKPEDEGCEVTHFSVDLELVKGKSGASLQGLKGDCGC